VAAIVKGVEEVVEDLTVAAVVMARTVKTEAVEAVAVVAEAEAIRRLVIILMKNGVLYRVNNAITF